MVSQILNEDAQCSNWQENMLQNYQKPNTTEEK